MFLLFTIFVFPLEGIQLHYYQNMSHSQAKLSSELIKIYYI